MLPTAIPLDRPRHRLLALAAVIALAATPAAVAQVQDFSFIHASDVHAPIAGSAKTIAEMPRGQRLSHQPFGVDVPAPSFVVVTGDLTEFGGAAAGRKAWEHYLKLWEGLGIPVYHVMGNHDATWDLLGPALRVAQGRTTPSFTHRGARCVIFDSSTPQDPLPSFGSGQERVLREALATGRPSEPLFLFWHHPPDDRGWASSRQLHGIEDLLEDRRVAAIFVGHYHRAFHARSDGLDFIGGGSTIPKRGTDRGFNLVSVQGGTLRISFKPFGETAWRPLLEKRLGERYARPLRITSARVRKRAGGGPTLQVEARLSRRAAAEASPELALEFRGRQGEMERLSGGKGLRWRGTLPLDGLVGGDYVVRASIAGGDAETWSDSRVFEVPGSRFKVAWRREDLGGVRATLIWQGRLVAVGDDGTVVIGERRRQLPGAVIAHPAICGDRILVFCGDGKVRAFDADGAQIYESDLGAPVLSSPVVRGDVVIAAAMTGELIGVRSQDGAVLWRIAAAGYAVESPLALADDLLVFGAWDQEIHAFRLDRDAGAAPRRLWRCRSGGCRQASGAHRYYSPADAPPAISGPHVYAADRAYVLSIIDRASGALSGTISDVVAVAAGPRPGSAVARARKDEVMLIEGKEVSWRVSVPTGRIPVPPVPTGDGRYLVVSDRGTLSVIRPGSDDPPAQVSLFTGGYHLATPQVAGDLAIFASHDGVVRALELPSVR